MAFGDRDFEIKIRTTADTTGIKQTEAELESLGKKSGNAIAPETAGIFEGISAGASLASVAVVAMGAAAYKTIKTISEFNAELNEELDKEVGSLERLEAKWHDVAAAADSLKDVHSLASNVVKEIDKMEDATRKLNAQTLTWSQSMAEAVAVLASFSKDPYLPMTESLNRAREEQKALTAEIVETGRAALKAAQDSSNAWDRMKNDTANVNENVENLKRSMAAYQEQLSKATDPTEIEFYSRKLVELENHLNTLTAIQTKENAAIDAAADAYGRKAEAAETAASKERDAAAKQAEKDLASASPQARAILMNEQAAKQAAAEGRERDAEQFAKSADQFRAGHEAASAEADKINREMKGVQQGDPEVIKALNDIKTASQQLLDAWR
jgi:hypothetical protein